MNRGAIFVAGVLSGALALGLVLVGWQAQVSVVPTQAPTPAVVATPAVVEAPTTVGAGSRVDLPSPPVPRAGGDAVPPPRPAVVA